MDLFSKIMNAFLVIMVALDAWGVVVMNDSLVRVTFIAMNIILIPLLLFLNNISHKMILSWLLSGMIVPASWIIILVLTNFQAPPPWVSAILSIFPFFLIIGLCWKGIDFLNSRIGVEEIISKRTRVLAGFGWTVFASYIGMLCGIISVLAAVIGFSMGISGLQAPEGYVWLSTGESTPAIAYVLALGFLVVGFVAGLWIYINFRKWADKITLRTIGTTFPSNLGILVLITAIIVTAEEIFFGWPIVNSILRMIPNAW